MKKQQKLDKAIVCHCAVNFKMLTNQSYSEKLLEEDGHCCEKILLSCLNKQINAD